MKWSEPPPSFPTIARVPVPGTRRLRLRKLLELKILKKLRTTYPGRRETYRKCFLLVPRRRTAVSRLIFAHAKNWWTGGTIGRVTITSGQTIFGCSGGRRWNKWPKTSLISRLRPENWPPKRFRSIRLARHVTVVAVRRFTTIRVFEDTSDINGGRTDGSKREHTRPQWTFINNSPRESRVIISTGRCRGRREDDAIDANRNDGGLRRETWIWS